VWINGGQGALGFTLAFGSAAVLRAQLEGAVSPLGASAAMELATA
jgi:D-amino-acid dehydrogenase